MDCGCELAGSSRPVGGRCSACYQRGARSGEIPIADYAPTAGFLQMDLSWHEDALCAETDPEMFFPEKGGSTREAKAVCSRCLVSVECLGYALDTGQRFGIWGGVSERRRRELLGLAEPDAEEAA